MAMACGCPTVSKHFMRESLAGVLFREVAVHGMLRQVVLDFLKVL